MSRLFLSLFCVTLCVLAAVAQVKPAIVERAVTLQRAMADAREQLAARRPADAAATLEAQLANIEGNKAFLSLLRDVYTEELRVMSATSTRFALVRERLILLGGTPMVATEGDSPKPLAQLDRDYAREAALAFQQEKWSEAAKLFAEAARVVKLSPAEETAWAFCKSRNEALSKSPDVADAHPVVDVVETESFRVRLAGSRASAEAIAKVAETKRKELFERWSGPVTGSWSPKCEIVLHADGESYAKSTGRPANGAGHATVRFAESKVAERKLDLRADDTHLLEDALPRELTHIVFADLFPSESPPLWAEAGIAVLDESTVEVERYQRTLLRCAREEELFAISSLLELKAYPEPARITAFYCQSVSLVEYLVKLRGERNFTIFLRDTKRYGLGSALKKTYELDGVAALEREWRRHALNAARAQTP